MEGEEENGGVGWFCFIIKGKVGRVLLVGPWFGLGFVLDLDFGVFNNNGGPVGIVTKQGPICNFRFLKDLCCQLFKLHIRTIPAKYG